MRLIVSQSDIKEPKVKRLAMRLVNRISLIIESLHLFSCSSINEAKKRPIE